MFLLRILSASALLVTSLTHSMDETPQTQSTLPIIKYDWLNFSNRTIAIGFTKHCIDNKLPFLHSFRVMPNQVLTGRILPPNHDDTELTKYHYYYKIVASDTWLSFFAHHHDSPSAAPYEIELKEIVNKTMPVKQVFHSHATLSVKMEAELNIELMHLAD